MELGVVGVDQRSGMKRKGSGLQWGKSEEGGAGRLGAVQSRGEAGLPQPPTLAFVSVKDFQDSSETKMMVDGQE